MVYGKTAPDGLNPLDDKRSLPVPPPNEMGAVRKHFPGWRQGWSICVYWGFYQSYPIISPIRPGEKSRLLY